MEPTTRQEAQVAAAQRKQATADKKDVTPPTNPDTGRVQR